MMHAARRACAGALKATKHSLTSTAVSSTAARALPTYFNTRKIVSFSLPICIFTENYVESMPTWTGLAFGSRP